MHGLSNGRSVDAWLRSPLPTLPLGVQSRLLGS
jgi:hypothetical protein